MKRDRPTRILRALAGASPGGLSTPALVEELAEGIGPRQQALSWYGSILRSYSEKGLVEEAGRTPGGWQCPPAVIWRITAKGTDRLAWIDDEPNRAAAFDKQRADQEEAIRQRNDALAGVALTCSPITSRADRRPIAARLRALGCTLEEIGALFGVSREMIRHDLLPVKLRPEREPCIPGPRFAGAVVLNSMVMIQAGQRKLYLTRAEARELASVINSADEVLAAEPLV